MTRPIVVCLTCATSPTGLQYWSNDSADVHPQRKGDMDDAAVHASGNADHIMVTGFNFRDQVNG